MRPFRPSSPEFEPHRAAALALLAVVLAAPVAAEAAERRSAETLVAACDDAHVLAKVRSRFAHGAARVEGRDLTLAAFGPIRDRGAFVDDPSPIPRRWCEAPVTLSDGTRSTAWWRIDRGTGFAAPGFAYLPDGIEV